MAKPPGPRTAGRARWRVQTISAGNFWRKAEFTSAAQVQSIRGSPRRAKPCGGVILHSLAPQLRLRKIPDFQRLFIILLNIEVCKLIFWGRRPCALQVGPGAWGAVLRTLRVGGAFPVPRGAAPRCPPGPGRGPGFLWKKAGGKNTRGKPLDPGFYSRSFPLADFWVGCLWDGRGAIPSGILKPIWDAFSRENMLKSIFAKESFQIRVRRWVPK